MHRLAASLHAPALLIDHDVAEGRDHRILASVCPSARTPELRSYSRHELDGAEWLRDVVVSARIEEPGLFRVGVPRGQHDDRRGRPRANLATHIESLHVGEPKIQNHERRRLGRREIDSVSSRRGFDDAYGARALRAVAVSGHVDWFRGQRVPDETPDLWFVIDDEHR
jgi:hypothetical protein